MAPSSSARTALLLPLLLLGLAACATVGQAAPRHVILMVIDDLGFGDVSYKNVTYPSWDFGPMIPTPTIDEYALGGIRLENYYVNYLCRRVPTRTSLLSGRYAWTIGMQKEVIVDGHPSCMPLPVKTIADHLSEGGWATSAYGKWDCGMTSWGCTPTCRGFHYFGGFYNAFNDYFTHRVGPGLDLRDGFKPDFANNNESGVYMTELVTTRVQDWASQTIARDPQKKTFAYVAHEAIHAPCQVPLHYLDGPCRKLVPAENPTRLLVCGMMQAVDQSLKNITETYKKLGILKDTVIIFSTDNGGNSDTGGSNYPLRGNKATLWEGGVRGVGWLGGPGLTQKSRAVATGLMHASDWLPTIVQGIAGLPLNASDLKRPGQPQPPPLDGVNQWDVLSSGAPSVRNEVLLNLAPDATCDPATCDVPGRSAIRVGDWKFVGGRTSVWGGNTPSSECTTRDGVAHATTSLPVTAATSPPWCPNGWVPSPTSGRPPRPPPDVACPSLPCTFPNATYIRGSEWLFNITADPFEEHDVAAQFPAVVAQLKAALAQYESQNITQDNDPTDPASDPRHFGGVWTPWRGDPVPEHCSTNDTIPGQQLRSNFDGLRCAAASNCSLVGWAWDPSVAGGRAHLNVSLSVDGKQVGVAVASVERDGLVPKTGAPDPYHGFVFPLATAPAAAMHHTFHAEVVYPDGVREVQKSPACSVGEKPTKCSP